MSDTPRIYVACLSSYNAGRLHGRWIDADQDADDIREEITEMLAESPVRGAEEYAIHDYENFGSLSLHEYENIETVARAAALIEEHGEVVGGLVDYYGGLDYLDEAERALEDGYAGAHDSLEHWVVEFLEDTGGLSEVPENLRSYFDYARYARDVEMSGDIFTVDVDGTIHVFWTRF